MRATDVRNLNGRNLTEEKLNDEAGILSGTEEVTKQSVEDEECCGGRLNTLDVEVAGDEIERGNDNDEKGSGKY